MSLFLFYILMLCLGAADLGQVSCCVVVVLVLSQTIGGVEERLKRGPDGAQALDGIRPPRNARVVMAYLFLCGF